MPYFPPQPERKPPEKSPRGRRLVKGIVLGVSLLLIGCGGVNLGMYIQDYVSVRRTAQELRDAAKAGSDGTGVGENSKLLPWQEAPSAEEAAPGLGTAAPGRENPALNERTSSVGEAAPGTEEANPLRENNQISGKGAAMTESAPSSLAAQSREKPVSGRLPAGEYHGGLQVGPRIRELRKKSEYILGWIAMEGMEEPVVRKDNTFFLTHDALGRRNSNGAIFMDERTSLLTRPYTILLYGHNMKTGAMFGGLRKYEDFSYFFRHRIFQLDTLYEEGQYAIFAVETIRLTPGMDRFLDVNALASEDRETRRKALAGLLRLNGHEPMLDVNEEDQLVLLITCTGDDDERLVVAARRLREGEQPDRLLARR